MDRDRSVGTTGGEHEDRVRRYLRYEELTRTLRALAEEHPDLCRVLSIGKSYGGREIWLAELTNSRRVLPSETGILG